MDNTTIDKDRIAKFKAQARVFSSEFERLKSRAPAIPERWRDEYARLLSQGETVKERIAASGAAIDTSYRFLRDSIGVPEEQINTMGFLPLVPLAFIGASTAVTSYFVTDAQKFNAKIDELERLQEMGYSAEEAAKIAGSNSISVPRPLAAFWNNPLLKWGSLGLVGWWGYRRYVRPRLQKR